MTFFDSWHSLGYTVLSGVIAYAWLVLFLRLSGKRTLAKMNAFDLIVTVALGSTLASVLTSSRLPVVNGLVALALLILLQYAVASLALRAPWFRRVIKSEPALLVRDGELLDEVLRRERVDRDEVLAAARTAGVDDLAEVRAMILETDGSLSVLPASNQRPRRPTLADVQRPHGRREGEGDTAQ